MFTTLLSKDAPVYSQKIYTTEIRGFWNPQKRELMSNVLFYFYCIYWKKYRGKWD